MSLRRSTRLANQHDKMPSKTTKKVQNTIPVTFSRSTSKSKEEKARKMDTRSPQEDKKPTMKTKKATTELKTNNDNPPMVHNYDQFPNLAPNTSLKLRDDTLKNDKHSTLVSPQKMDGAWAKTLKYAEEKETKIKIQTNPEKMYLEVKESEETEKDGLFNYDKDDDETVETIKDRKYNQKKNDDKGYNNNKEHNLKIKKKAKNFKKEDNNAQDEDTIETMINLEGNEAKNEAKNNKKHGKNKTKKNAKWTENEEIEDDNTVNTIESLNYKQNNNNNNNKNKLNENDNAKDNTEKNKQKIYNSELDMKQKYKKNNEENPKGKNIGFEVTDDEEETVCTNKEMTQKGETETNNKKTTNEDEKDKTDERKKENNDKKIKDVTTLGVYRYRLTINIPSIEKAKLYALRDGTENEKVNTDPDARIHEILTDWYKTIQQYDESARLLTWSEKNTDVVMSPERIPRDPTSRNKYFQNVKAVAKDEFRIFANVRVYSKLDPEEMVENMRSWSTMNAAFFTKTLIQAEYCVEIGWLACTSQFSDPQVFKEKMEEITGYEWGFKLTAITDSDKMDNKGNPTPWPKRIKALSATVPFKHKKNATDVMNAIFGMNKKDKSTGINKPKIPYADKYIFMEMERNTKSKNRQLNLMMRQRQAIINRTTRAVFISSIVGNIDKKN